MYIQERNTELRYLSCQIFADNTVVVFVIISFLDIVFDPEQTPLIKLQPKRCLQLHVQSPQGPNFIVIINNINHKEYGGC